MRADQLLVARGLAASRTQAQRMIEAGRVRCDGLPVRKPSDALRADAPLALEDDPHDRYVSRGGVKLAGALAHTGVDVRGRVCLDVGVSTGGFADCLLQAGAERVVGVDVGHGQLHPRLAREPRLRAFEGINARALSRASLGDAMPARGFDVVVCDVSFISLTLVLPALAALAARAATLLALVKPQFEAGAAALDARGIVKARGAERAYAEVRERVTECASRHGWRVLDWFDSPIRGGDGNREFFLHACHDTDPELRVLPA